MTALTWLADNWQMVAGIGGLCISFLLTLTLWNAGGLAKRNDKELERMRGGNDSAVGKSK